MRVWEGLYGQKTILLILVKRRKGKRMRKIKKGKKVKEAYNLDHAGDYRKEDRARSTAPPPITGCGRQSSGNNLIRKTPCPSPNRT
jgi:hypothetical protein